VLTIKQAGNWTRRLYALVNAVSHDCDAEKSVGCEVRVLVECPYGGPGHTMYAEFNTALFVADGSGITYALECAWDVIQKAADRCARTKVVKLVWVVREPVRLVLATVRTLEGLSRLGCLGCAIEAEVVQRLS
jgi:ferric-chelate reductase